MTESGMPELNISIPNSPLSTTRGSYDRETERMRYQMNKVLIQEKYKYEKFIGKRRKTGEKNLNKLRPEHLSWVSAYINGMTGVQIAEAYDTAAITVYRVLNDPLAQEIIDEFKVHARAEFEQMFPQVAEAIRVGLDSSSVTTRLKAVDRWVKLHGSLEEVKDGPESKREAISAARLKVVTMIQEAVKDPNVIEAEAIVIESG